MQAITFRVQIPSTRSLTFDLPATIPPGPAEVLLVVQPESSEGSSGASPSPSSSLTIDDLGWTEAKAAEVRTHLASFVEDWDDPRMDIYNDF